MRKHRKEKKKCKEKKTKAACMRSAARLQQITSMYSTGRGIQSAVPNLLGRFPMVAHLISSGDGY